MRSKSHTESQVLKMYDTWLHSYLNGDVETYDSYFDDEYHFIGSTNNEEFLSRKDTTQFFAATADQLAGKCDLRNETRTLEQFGDLIFITHVFDAWFRNGSDYSYYGRFRFTNALRENNEGWRFIYQHFSTPDTKADEGETIGFNKITEENKELREAIKRRTIELEQKNRDLSVEAALEKVRSRTMAMQHSDELAEASFLLDSQVRELGIKTWGCAFNIYGKDESTEWFGNEAGVLHTYTVPREGIFKQYYERGQQGESLYVQEFEGEACVAHYEYMSSLPVIGDVLKKLKETNNGFPTYQIDHVVYFKYGYLLFITREAVPEAHDIFKRFAQVFEQTYTRFLDLQRAERQAREAQIEAALERVRSRSMAMHQSEEIGAVAQVLFQQLKNLGGDLWGTGFGFCSDNSEVDEFWFANESGIMPFLSIPNTEDPVHREMYEGWKKNRSSFSISKEGHELEDHYRYMLSVPDVQPIFQAILDKGISFPTWQKWHAAYFKYGYLLVITTQPYEDEEIFKRFANVFEQAYTRFLDLQTAEAQAKESKIESSLEKVRNVALSMNESDDLLDIAKVLYEQLLELGFQDIRNAIIDVNNEDDETFMDYDYSHEMGGTVTLMAYEDDPTLEEQVRQIATTTDGYSEMVLEGQQLQDLIEMRRNNGEADDPRLLATNSISYILYAFGNGAIGISNFGLLTEAQKSILNRFRNVFTFAYKRYSDLAQAEAQAREAMIEVALERARTQSMLMQHSDELDRTIQVFHEQLHALGIASKFSYLWLPDETQDTHLFWATWLDANSKSKTKKVVYPLDREDPAIIACYNAWESDLTVHVNTVERDAVMAYFTTWNELLQGVSHMEADKFPDGLYYVDTYMKYGCLGILLKEAPSEEDKSILGRFSKEFERAYTRFLDLKKAEAQAREAQIEAALERVRSRTLAMHQSNELPETAMVVFQQLMGLGIAPNRLYIGVIKGDDGLIEMWATDEEGSAINTEVIFDSRKSKAIAKIYNGWKTKKKSLSLSMQRKELASYLSYLTGELGISVKEDHRQKKRVQTLAYFSSGFIGIASPDTQPEATTQLLERFASVFNLTYTRFSDLQNAEAQAREATIEAALERVRARALAMQQPEELKEVAKALRTEMGQLGIETLETCSIYIRDEKEQKTECWYAIKDLRSKSKKLVTDHFRLDLEATWVGRQMHGFYESQKERVSIEMTGANRVEWIRYCEKNSAPFQGHYGKTIPDRTYHLHKFSHGAIGVATVGAISGENWELLRRAASVFSLAYSRFKDLTQAREDLQKLKTEKQRAEEALSELQQAQKLLVQSEKMASLGELTAGIAHEIQNPLNFVNNFSEVSQELLDEMRKELEAGNLDDVRELMRDVIQNLEKINHHGRRADGIVKGMLQHSRKSTGEKVPTGINELVEEYLRLAYHGLRAKDKSFNATLVTDYDESIQKLEIVPQEIGRVVLNLISNAFYASTQRKLQLKNEKGENDGLFEPTVWISTKRNSHKNTALKNTVEIAIRDNGIGMPKQLVEKIFQPFFTTKPSGQGTGLGLSLSYDIIKAHEGKLEVTTQEGVGTTFTILLPTGTQPKTKPKTPK